jgi:hypothetical protein
MVRAAARERVYARGVSDEDRKKTKLGWRLFWGVVGAGLTFTVLSVSGWAVAPPLVYGLSVAMGILVGIFGPMLLDLLTLA